MLFSDEFIQEIFVVESKITILTKVCKSAMAVRAMETAMATVQIEHWYWYFCCYKRCHKNYTFLAFSR